MNILLISQCNKKALPETRRVLDQFAERKGDKTWQTPITLQGLNTLRQLLKKTARRNTAVACHWIRSKNTTELVWVVGNQRKFNIDGTVPTNITRRNILRSEDENAWHTAEDISLLAGIAALFHDFGKANELFQNKINPKKQGKLSEPYRHEWVSLRLFQSFVGKLSDQAWLEKLSQVQPKDNDSVLQSLIKDHPVNGQFDSPFNRLPPVAQAVSWLILTHHKLPYDNGGKGEANRLDQADKHLTKKLSPKWNSPQISTREWSGKELQQVWLFKHGTAINSTTWCAKARSIGKRALKRQPFLKEQTHYLTDKYTLHLARLSLMLADHHYSSLPSNKYLCDKKYKAFANSDRKTGQLKQKLDEHLIGVYKHSLQFVRLLPSLKTSLPAITDIRALKKRNTNKRFRWQDKAFDLAKAIVHDADNNGFFGVNMASTGCGKTLANARIMYGLSDNRDGCRFSVALGLRTLTLQTGDALKQRLNLSDDDLAVLIGSQAVTSLYNLAKETTQTERISLGSESANELLEQDQYVQYTGQLFDGALKQWLVQKPKLHKLLSAPILVSTIDHLIPATESARGGKQIAPMLRLLTADLVLDEPDEFDVADLPALTRLVNWAGLLGAKVLLSSATLPPAAVEAMFVAYQEGRSHFNKARGIQPQSIKPVCCAWFDEFNVQHNMLYTQAEFTAQHQNFVDKRITKLAAQSTLHQAQIAPLTKVNNEPELISEVLASTILQQCYQLHLNHHQIAPTTQLHKTLKNKGQQVSIGLVRMANINPLIAVAKQIAATNVIADFHIHLCVYHSQFPLIVRSSIENTLDAVLNRTEPDALWQNEVIINGLKQSKAKNHIFLIMATSVAETGRDWDLDWAIAEPSSMRSTIQLAGRVQRHRRTVTNKPNIVLLNSNYRALNQPSAPAFCKPGFESPHFKLNSHELLNLLTTEQYENINAIARIKARTDFDQEKNWRNNLVDLEHYHLQQVLFNNANKVGAHYWWTKPCHLTYQLQKQTPFRASAPSDNYYIQLADIDNEIIDEGIMGENIVDKEGINKEQSYNLTFKRWHANGEVKIADNQFNMVKETFNTKMSTWAVQNINELVAPIANKLTLNVEQACITFTAFNLRDTDKKWCYSNEFGIYQALYESA